eukprot:203675-Pyramimonas_sp.AAC.3
MSLSSTAASRPAASADCEVAGAWEAISSSFEAVFKVFCFCFLFNLRRASLAAGPVADNKSAPSMRPEKAYPWLQLHRYNPKRNPDTTTCRQMHSHVLTWEANLKGRFYLTSTL